MVNFHLGTGSSRRWTWREAWWAFSLRLPKITGIYKFQLAGKWSESENQMSCYTILWEPVWAENGWFWPFNLELQNSNGNMFCVLRRRRVVSALYGICSYCHEMRLHCYFLLSKARFFPFQRLACVQTSPPPSGKPLKFKLSAKNT